MGERLHIITNKKKLQLPIRGILVEAHPDDAAMAMIDHALAEKGVGLTIATFTDGAARILPHFTSEELRLERRKESPKSGKISGAAQVMGADLPDGKLSEYQEEGKAFLNEIIAETHPHFLIAPHPGDPHPDHAIAGEITRLIAGGDLPVYFMDTITGKDKDSNDIVPTHVIPLSRRNIRKRRKAYLAHKSQVFGLPEDEQQAVQSVLDMPKRRGEEFGIPTAGVLIKDTIHETTDPVTKIFGADIFIESSLSEKM